MWSKMKNGFYAICGLGLILCSCQKGEEGVRMDSARSIYLRATVENTHTTRAPFFLSAPDQQNPLEAAVWASTDELEGFPDGTDNGKDGKVALHTSAKFTSGEEQLLNDAVYPKEGGAKVYFVGFHPIDGWATPRADDPDPAQAAKAGKIATKTFDGSEDVMFAPKISGEYAQNVTEWPRFEFRHLLTWLRVSIKADGEAVSKAWGRLKSLKVKSAAGVTIDLIGEYDPAAPRNRVSFSGDTELNFYKTGTDDLFVNPDDESTWFTLPPDEAADAVAYVLCAPVQASENDPDQWPATVRTTEYTLLVETENRSVEVPIDLMKDASADPPAYFKDYTMNDRFTLNLNFKMGNNITVTAKVTDWQAGGISNGVLDPNDSAINPDDTNK